MFANIETSNSSIRHETGSQEKTPSRTRKTLTRSMSLESDDYEGFDVIDIDEPSPHPVAFDDESISIHMDESRRRSLRERMTRSSQGKKSGLLQRHLSRSASMSKLVVGTRSRRNRKVNQENSVSGLDAPAQTEEPDEKPIGLRHKCEPEQSDQLTPPNRIDRTSKRSSRPPLSRKASLTRVTTSSRVKTENRDNKTTEVHEARTDVATEDNFASTKVVVQESETNVASDSEENAISRQRRPLTRQLSTRLMRNEKTQLTRQRSERSLSLRKSGSEQSLLGGQARLERDLRRTSSNRALNIERSASFSETEEKEGKIPNTTHSGRGNNQLTRSRSDKRSDNERDIRAHKIDRSVSFNEKEENEAKPPKLAQSGRGRGSSKLSRSRSERIERSDNERDIQKRDGSECRSLEKCRNSEKDDSHLSRSDGAKQEGSGARPRLERSRSRPRLERTRSSSGKSSRRLDRSSRNLLYQDSTDEERSPRRRSLRKSKSEKNLMSTSGRAPIRSRSKGSGCENSPHNRAKPKQAVEQTPNYPLRRPSMVCAAEADCTKPLRRPSIFNSSVGQSSGESTSLLNLKDVPTIKPVSCRDDQSVSATTHSTATTATGYLQMDLAAGSCSKLQRPTTSLGQLNKKESV